MSKAVRIRDHLYAEIEALAKSERRSLISQLEVLLEQALTIERSGAAVGYRAESGSAVLPSEEKESLLRASSRPERAASDTDVKPDFK